jgi:hypothetical protein
MRQDWIVCPENKYNKKERGIYYEDCCIKLEYAS